MNRVIKSLEKLSPELKQLLRKEYPDGFEDCIMRINNHKNEPIFVVPLNTDDTNYLIKIAVVQTGDGDYDIDPDIDDLTDSGDNDLDEADFDL